MKSEIKVLDSNQWLGKNGQLMLTLWCMITITTESGSVYKFPRTFVVKAR